MPEKSFWPKRITLLALLPTLLVVFVVGVFLFRNAIVSSIINYSVSANEMTAECLEFDLEWNLNAKITQLCLKHPMADITISDAKWNFWQNTLSIQALKVNHFNNTSDANEIANNDAQPFVMPSFEFLHQLPLLDIKQLVVTSPWLTEPINLQITQHSATTFQLLGAIEAKVAFYKGIILAELNWRVANVTRHLAEAKTSLEEVSTVFDINAFEQTKIVSKIEFDGNKITTSNQINFNNTVSLHNCRVPIMAKGNISINGKLDDLSAEIDLSKLTIAAQLESCQTLNDISELRKFEELHISIPQVITFQNKNATLAELNAIIPGQTQSWLKLSNLTFSLNGQSSMDYTLSLEPDTSDNLHVSKLTFSSAGNILSEGENLQWHSQQNRLEVINAQGHPYAAQPTEASFDLQFSKAQGIKLKGSLLSSQIKLPEAEAKIGKFTSIFNLNGPNLNNLQLNAENLFNNISYGPLPVNASVEKIKTIENTKPQVKLAIKQLTTNIDLQFTNLNQFTAIADSQLNQINVFSLPFTQMSIKHQMQGDITQQTISSLHNIVLDKIFSANLEQQQQQFQLQLNEQSLSNAKSIIKAAIPELNITQGIFSANLVGNIETLALDGTFQLENIFATFKNYQIKDLKYKNSFILNSAGLQLAPSKITLESVDVGIPIQRIQASLSAADSLLRLENISGEIFGGRFSFGNIWLDGRDQLTEIELNDIELAQVIELQKQSGIKVTGQVKGSLPVHLDKGGVRIESGAVFSQGPGKLRIIDNPAFDSIKAQQAELAFLENMDFTQLSSKVKLQPDGWLFLDFSILGSNPDKKQSLKFNYSHQENILTLLKSLRMASSVQDKIEKSLKEGGKK